jgi:hypothetical protein
MKHTEGKVRFGGGHDAVSDEGHVIARFNGIGVVVAMSEADENLLRFKLLWNAADGMSNEDAVKALENYVEMKEALLSVCGNYCSNMQLKCGECPIGFIGDKLNTEGK